MKSPWNWELESLVPNPEGQDFAKVLEKYRAELTRLAEESDRLPAVDSSAAHVKSWVTFLTGVAEVETVASDLGSGVACYAAGDAANKTYQKCEATLASLSPLREKIVTNIELALRAVSEEDLNRWVESDAGLKAIGYFLKSRRKNAAFRLPKEQELLAADLGVDGIHAWGRLFDRISGALRVKVMERGEVVEKSPGQVRFDLPDRASRENNFFAADKAWKSIEEDCAAALNHISGTRLTLYRRLGLKDHLESPLRFNRMKRETLDAMWGAISERKGMLVDFCQRKAKLLGIERLAWWDTTAPLPLGAAASREISYDAAVEEIVEAFTEFTGDLGEFARMGVNDRWIEAENRSGKRQGGFCTGFPGAKQSRIFMTFTNTDDSMSTLAHELGHAYHSHILRDQPVFLQDYPMNLAETASTFAEAILAGRRLKRTTDSAARLQMLDGMLTDAVVYLMNIHSRFLFEDAFHKERPEGEISPERFSELMVDAQQKGYAGALSDWNGRLWASKLHFYISGLPFYNFPYTFGYLLSLGIYSVAGERGSAFAEQYKKFLLATGCCDAEEAVQSSLGYDLTKGDFWHKSLDLVESRVQEFLKATA